MPPIAPAAPAMSALVLTPNRELWRVASAVLTDAGYAAQQARTARDAVSALVSMRPPRVQVAIVDFDVLDAADILQLHEARSGGWFGTVIGLGTIDAAVRASLPVERVLRAPLSPPALRHSLESIGLNRMTTKVPVILRE